MTVDYTIQVTHSFDPAFLTLLEKLMATFEEMSTKLDTMSTTVATIKTEIDALKAARDAGGMSAEQEAAIDAKLDVLTTALNEAAAAGA